jgi:signal transduction histidine kinase
MRAHEQDNAHSKVIQSGQDQMALLALQKRARRWLVAQPPLSWPQAAAVPLSREYRTWRERFICDRIRLAIFISMALLAIMALLQLGLILPALNRSGEQDLSLRSDRVLFSLCVLAAQELGLLLNLLLLKRDCRLPKLQLAFWGFSGAVLMLPQLQHMLIGETLLDLGGWIIFSMLQAVLIPVKWRWHLIAQVSLLSLTLISWIALGFDSPSISDAMRVPVYIFFVVLASCVFFVADLGVYLYERLLIREFELRQQLQLFLHAVSHDLRNPVTGTLMLLKNLRRDDQGRVTLSPPVMNQVIESQERQLQLIHSLLEVHAHEAQGIQLQRQLLQVGPFVQSIVQEQQSLAYQSQTRITSRVSPDLPPVMADPLQLRRVYENMIANALQYNRPGVCIRLDSKVKGNWLRCTISDDGQGMTLLECSRIFERYSRGVNRRQPMHLGLGLYICHQIIKAHGGNIGVDSEPGQGTTFWFTLPLANPAIFS